MVLMVWGAGVAMVSLTFIYSLGAVCVALLLVYLVCALVHTPSYWRMRYQALVWPIRGSAIRPKQHRRKAQR
jgi:fumarate reductase subunit C